MDTIRPHQPRPEGAPMSFREAEAIARICIAKLATEHVSFAHPAITTSEELGKVMHSAKYIAQQMVQQARSQYHMETGKELAWP